MHRLHAWTVIDPERYSARIKEEADALLQLQNPDGGWHELGQPGRPSAVYATGQMAWTLMAAGVPRDDPRIARALALLLEKQLPFGGWFETTTHENFRTPMRETRYALEALAAGFPRASGPLTSWGNRDGLAAWLPRAGPLVATLDDLDNLWDVPVADQPRFARAILPLLDHADPFVRSRAAAAMGRLGDPSAVEALAAHLGDPSKIVARSAAWSLRKLGNRGIGVAAIKQALASPDPATRRGAVRIFAQQFSGMDTRPDLADQLIGLTGDPDFRTRLEAIRSLRQWFYRTADTGLQRRIVDAYLARMAVPDAPVIRKALAEGMYIMLDENLGGGVSLARTLAILPDRFRQKAIAGREATERDVLLGPVLAALEAGNALQKEALIRSFDGSFFRGRFYARRPTGMIDVGNDREFGFLIEPPADLVDRVFTALLAAPDLPAGARAGAIRLASFFLVTGRSDQPAVQSSVLRGLLDPDAEVRAAAGPVVARDLSLAGASADPDRIALIRQALAAAEPERRAILAALAREPALLAVPAIVTDLRSQLGDDARFAGLAPALRGPAFTDAEVVEAATRVWPRLVEPADRLLWLDAVLGRPAVLGADAAAPDLAHLFRLAGRDPASAVRERAIEAVGASPPLRSSRAGQALLLAALADDTPSSRRLALDLASDQPGFWARPEARERLLARLVDPDASVRDRALAIVGRLDLARADPAVARRVKSLAADVRLGRPRLLSLATFRDRINPLFRQPGEDGVSCIQCHANQNVFRVVADADAVAINYQSTLKALNLGDPESSLLFRKPRSPRGAGDRDGASPTGLTHNGGPRWEANHPAYGALRAWINEVGPADGAQPPISADGYRPGFEPARATDGDLDTAWQTETEGAIPGYPHELVVDLGIRQRVDGLLAVPRQSGSDGRVRDFEVSLSDDGTTWNQPVARGTWPDDPSFRYVPLAGQPARFVRLRGLSEVGGGPTMSLAELVVDASPLTQPSPREPAH